MIAIITNEADEDIAQWIINSSNSDNNVSSYVFDVNVSWAYTETPDLEGKEELYEVAV